MRRRREGGV